jgi:hypothetical protein
MSLSYDPLSAHTVHLCIDMQNVFAEPTPWHTPWMTRTRVPPAIEAGTPSRPCSLALYRRRSQEICLEPGVGISSIGKK